MCGLGTGALKSGPFSRAITALITGAAALSLPLGSALTGPAAQASPAAVCSPALAKIALSPASVPGGAGSTVTATLSCATPKALSITLKGFSGVRVPSVLHVAAGKETGSAAIATATTSKAKRGWITATLGKVLREALLTVGVTPKTCKSPVLASATLPALAYVGDHPVLALKLSCTAAATVKITLTASVTPSGPSGASLPVPASVTIGKYYSAATVTLTLKAYEPGQYKATISARLGSRSFTRTITVDPGLASFTNSPDSCSPNDVNLDVLFTGILPAGGLTVKLKSNNAAVTLPATYSFSPPSIGGGVGPQGVVVKPVQTTTKVTLSATLGSRTLTLPVTLIPTWKAGDKITLTLVNGSGPYYGPSGGYSLGVGLSNPAPAGDTPLVGTVTSSAPNDVELETGNTLGIDPGCISTYLSFQVPYETNPVHATITVTIGSSKASIPVTVEPSIASVTVPPTIVGGSTQPEFGTVTLAGKPDEPETVYVQSSWGIVTVPGIVTIPAGQISATFPITTATVTTDSSVFISAMHTVADQVADTVYSNDIDVTPAP
jgi:hypothetical protein